MYFCWYNKSSLAEPLIFWSLSKAHINCIIFYYPSPVVVPKAIWWMYFCWYNKSVSPNLSYFDRCQNTNQLIIDHHLLPIPTLYLTVKSVQVQAVTVVLAAIVASSAAASFNEPVAVAVASPSAPLVWTCRVWASAWSPSFWWSKFPFFVPLFRSWLHWLLPLFMLRFGRTCSISVCISMSISTCYVVCMCGMVTYYFDRCWVFVLPLLWGRCEAAFVSSFALLLDKYRWWTQRMKGAVSDNRIFCPTRWGQRVLAY